MLRCVCVRPCVRVSVYACPMSAGLMCVCISAGVWMRAYACECVCMCACECECGDGCERRYVQVPSSAL